MQWLLTLGNGGAKTNAKVASERPRNEAARLDALLNHLAPSTERQPAA